MSDGKKIRTMFSFNSRWRQNYIVNYWIYSIVCSWNVGFMKYCWKVLHHLQNCTVRRQLAVQLDNQFVPFTTKSPTREINLLGSTRDREGKDFEPCLKIETSKQRDETIWLCLSLSNFSSLQISYYQIILDFFEMVLRDAIGGLRDRIKIHSHGTFTEHRSQDSRLALEIDVRPNISLGIITSDSDHLNCHEIPYIACTAWWQHLCFQNSCN